MLRCKILFILCSILLTARSTRTILPTIRKFLSTGCIAFATFNCIPIDTLHLKSVAYAAVADLADVGVKEFLVKDGRQHLRLTIPSIDDKMYSNDIKLAQENLELVRLRFEQVGYSNPSAWGTAIKDVNVASNLIKSHDKELLSNANDEKRKYANSLFETVLLPKILQLTDSLRVRDIATTLAAQESAADALAKLRLLQIPEHTLPFQIPEEYTSLPKLKGRATIEMVVQSANGFRLENSKEKIPTIRFEMVVDGYHAPITAGNFVDLVNKKFYNGMPIEKVQELIVQFGNDGSISQANVDSNGNYIDPATKKIRKIPLEIFYKSEKEPVYGITSDDDLRAKETMALPFQGVGAIGMARSNDDADSASNEVFFLKWQQALVPPGRNTLDGYYSCFGYVTKNEEFLSQVNEKTDRIISMQVIDGLDNLEL